MRISLNWLSDYIDIKKVPAAQIAKALTDIGLEVETIESSSALKGDVIVGKITAAEKHPDADTLRLCKVDVGRGEPLDIVCGAPNASAGIKVCVALAGSTLPGDFKIKKSKIRGAVSNGMMCAEDELGISKNHDTIIEVDEAVEIGTSVAALYNLEDTVLTLGITPNRGDCLGYLGVARDLSAKLGLPLKYPDHRKVKLDPDLKTSAKVTVRVEDADDCPRFTAVAVRGVKPCASPAWMQRRLEAAGMRPINSIVDVTNYVMLEYGQPIHAYDERGLAKKQINVRRAKEGESLRTLDGNERTLVASDLLICDGDGPVGLAGVMGGAHSEVKDDTDAIVIEVAIFDPRLVRKTAKRLAMHTEASHRFERGCDPQACDKVAWRVAALLQQIAEENGQAAVHVAAELIDLYDGKLAPTKIALRSERARHILGMSVLNPTRMVDALHGLGLTLLDQTADHERLLFQIPSWRRDLVREIDLIEEVGRMIGYEEIPFRLPQMEIGGTREQPFIEFIDQSKRVLANQGFTEVISFPFIGDEQLRAFGLPDDHPLRKNVWLANPLAEQENRLRSSLAFSLVNAVVNNRRRGVKGARLFECGRIYLMPQPATANMSYLSHLAEQGLHMSQRAKDDHRCIERSQLAFIFDQPYRAKGWQGPEEGATFFHAKAAAQDLLAAFGVKTVELIPDASSDLPFMHPGASALIKVDAKMIGYLGALHPEVAQTLDFDPKAPPVFCELNLDRSFVALSKPLKVDTAERKFPPVHLDFAFIVDAKVSYQSLRDAIARFNGKRNLREYRLFDVYQGDKLPEGKKSLALSFSFQSPKRTLSDKEVEMEVDALKAWLKQDVGADLR